MIGPYRNFLKALRVRKLNARRAEILLMIKDQGPTRPTEMVKALRSATPNIDTDLRWLLGKKLIKQQSKPGEKPDRRSRFYNLTATGQSTVVSLVATA